MGFWQEGKACLLTRGCQPTSTYNVTISPLSLPDNVVVKSLQLFNAGLEGRDSKATAKYSSKVVINSTAIVQTLACGGVLYYNSCPCNSPSSAVQLRENTYIIKTRDGSEKSILVCFLQASTGAT